MVLVSWNYQSSLNCLPPVSSLFSTTSLGMISPCSVPHNVSSLRHSFWLASSDGLSPLWRTSTLLCQGWGWGQKLASPRVIPPLCAWALGKGWETLLSFPLHARTLHPTRHLGWGGEIKAPVFLDPAKPSVEPLSYKWDLCWGRNF